MKITILGSGSAYGVPMIFNQWRNANPENPKNIRTRACVLIEENGKSVLIDAGPDLRQQINSFNIKDVDALLLTHGHYDHIGGVPELPRASTLLGHGIDVWASEETMSELKISYGYLFRGEEPEGVGIHWKTLPDLGKFECCGLNFETYRVPHHHLHSSAFRLGDFAYMTDWEDISEDGINVLRGVKCLLVECNNGLYYEKNGHSNLDKVKEIAVKIGDPRIVLTHLSARVDYDELAKFVPEHWLPAYDLSLIHI